MLTLLLVIFKYGLGVKFRWRLFAKLLIFWELAKLPIKKTGSSEIS
jgi:hypothetical protein